MDQLLHDSGEGLFHLGFNEDGTCAGLSAEAYTDSLERLKERATQLSCRLRVLLEEVTACGHYHSHQQKCHSGWVLLRRIPTTQGGVSQVPEVRVAVVGNVDAGKSTLLGVLTRGGLDDGRGRARIAMFRHRHEVDTGRTSSIGQEIAGFDEEGHSVAEKLLSDPSGNRRISWEEICRASHKLITFLDLAGHERYLKTTMFGLTGGSPDYGLLVVGGNAGLIGMAKEHLALAVALQLPLIVVVTKLDSTPAGVMETSLRGLQKALKSASCRRVPVGVRSVADVLTAVHGLTSVQQRITPILQVSSVTGEGLDLLQLLLQLLPLPSRYRPEEPAEFQITETYSVPGVGTVVAGTLLSGSLRLGQTVYLGPSDSAMENVNGNSNSSNLFTSTQIKGIHRRRTPVEVAYAGQSASFALKKTKRAAIRLGMVLVDRARLDQMSIADPNSLSVGRPCREFEAEVLILFHSTTIGPKYQAMLHCGVVRQTVSIVAFGRDASVLRTGDRARVRFRFLKRPEYLRVGMRLLFREGRTKGVGKISALFD